MRSINMMIFLLTHTISYAKCTCCTQISLSSSCMSVWLYRSAIVGWVRGVQMYKNTRKSARKKDCEQILQPRMKPKLKVFSEWCKTVIRTPHKPVNTSLLQHDLISSDLHLSPRTSGLLTLRSIPTKQSSNSPLIAHSYLHRTNSSAINPAKQFVRNSTRGKQVG